jgi:4-hydroxyphenylpyruvate dioxygenase-like putative hemolysin
MSVHSKVSFEVPKDKTLRKAILKFLQNKILNKNSVGSHLNIEHKSNAIYATSILIPKNNVLQVLIQIFSKLIQEIFFFK